MAVFLQNTSRTPPPPYQEVPSTAQEDLVHIDNTVVTGEPVIPTAVPLYVPDVENASISATGGQKGSAPPPVEGGQQQGLVVGVTTGMEGNDRVVDGLPTALAVEMTPEQPQLLLERSGGRGERYPPESVEDLAMPQVRKGVDLEGRRLREGWYNTLEYFLGG